MSEQQQAPQLPRSRQGHVLSTLSATRILPRQALFHSSLAVLVMLVATTAVSCQFVPVPPVQPKQLQPGEAYIVNPETRQTTSVPLSCTLVRALANKHLGALSKHDTFQPFWTDHRAFHRAQHSTPYTLPPPFCPIVSAHEPPLTRAL
jgi:hypothetical protein